MIVAPFSMGIAGIIAGAGVVIGLVGSGRCDI